MKTTVVITPMLSPEKQIVKNFTTESKARDYFDDVCNEKGYKQNGDEAGGRGHDFRIELIESNEKEKI